MKAAALLALVLTACGPNGPQGMWQGHNTRTVYEPFMIDVKNSGPDEVAVTVTSWNNDRKPVSVPKLAAGQVVRVVVGDTPDGFAIYSTRWAGARYGGTRTWDRAQFSTWLVVEVNVPTGELVGEIRAR